MTEEEEDCGTTKQTPDVAGAAKPHGVLSLVLGFARAESIQGRFLLSFLVICNMNCRFNTWPLARVWTVIL